MPCTGTQALAQLHPEPASSGALRGRSVGTEPQHTEDGSQVAGWTQQLSLEAQGIPWKSGGLVLNFIRPQFAAAPLGTSNLPHRGRALCVPLRPWGWAGHSGAVPGRATGELGAQGTPAHPAVPPTPLHQSQLPFWAAECQRGPFPPLCRYSGCRSPSRTPLLPRFPCVPWDKWVAAAEEGRRAGASRSSEVRAAFPGADPPPARPQGPAKGQGHQTGAKPGVLGGQLPVTAAQDGAVTSGACVSLFPAQERAWEHSQGSMGGRARMKMSPNCIWSPG